MAVDLELASILMDVKNEIRNTMIRHEEVCKTMFATYAKNNVLDVYDPASYVRRSEAGAYGGTTGIADEKSYDVAVSPDLLMTVTSNVQGNPRYENAKDGWDPGNITDIIESGSGYNWKRSEIYKSGLPRPWMEEAGTDFSENLLMPMIDMALKNLLGG